MRTQLCLGDRYRARHRRGAQSLIFERLYQTRTRSTTIARAWGSAYLSAKNWCGCKAGGWVASDPGQGSIFTFTFASLLSAHAAGACRCARGTLRPRLCWCEWNWQPSEATAWDWRETGNNVSNLAPLCVSRQDLVLPPMWESGRPRLSL